jgi:pimeloyl-ACP methyl ester carboxylesterase
MNYVMNDVLGLLDALGEKKAVLVGHDFGAPLVWNLAVRHPDRVAALIVLSVPYDFDLAGRGGAGSGQPTGATANDKFTVDCAVPGVRPTEVFAGVARDHFIHMHYFQQIGPPEAELGGKARLFLTRLFYALSARGRLLDWRNFPTAGTGYLDVLAEPPTSPPWPWLSREDLDTYVSEYERTGPATTFIGGLNSYRNADRNWELGAPYADANVQQPTLFIAGQQDPVLQMIDPNAIEIMKRRVPNLRDIVLVPDAGHFVQQEQPAAVNAAMAKFLRSLR